MIIAHSCTKCSHADYHRESRSGGRNAHCPLPCGCQPCEPGESTLRPTFGPAGQVIERIIPPGGKGEGNYLSACGCQGCKALFELLSQTVTAGAS